MGLFNFFQRKQKPKSLLEVSSMIIVHTYRQISKQSGNKLAPTSKTSDQEIINIYKEVFSSFREAAKIRNEHIPAVYLNGIVLKFLMVYELNKEFYYEHLQYEVDKYIKEGLREDYKRELNLF